MMVDMIKQIDRGKMDYLRQNYETASMNEEQFQRLKEAIAKGRADKRVIRYRGRWKAVGAVAAVLLLFLILPNTSEKIAEAMGNIPVLGRLVKVVTIREYQYEDEGHMADVIVPKLDTEREPSEDTSGGELKKSTDEMNKEIQKITEEKIAEFKKEKKQEGYRGLKIEPEVIVQNEKYFTLKLTCFQSKADGYEENYFYTIDLNTGKRLSLSDFFIEESDYISRISDNIKKQMREQMKEDENKDYWIDDEEFPEYNFESIRPDTQFYINAEEEVVICFNEGDVAPMYMGAVEFVIPDEAIKDIRVE